MNMEVLDGSLKSVCRMPAVKKDQALESMVNTYMPWL